MDRLILEDGAVFEGKAFGFPLSASGEVVFNTGMVGYPEALTDPSYRGQILALTYPLIGNYGVAGPDSLNDLGNALESSRIQIAGLIVSELSLNHNHWKATRSLLDWLNEGEVPVLSGVDTRALTKHIRNQGSMIGKMLAGESEVDFYDPNQHNLVDQVSIVEPIIYPGGSKRIIVIDCGCKFSLLRSLRRRGVTIIRVPWDYDFLDEDFDGVLISNGPGDPKMCSRTISQVQRVMEKQYPVFGVCLGHQILALAAGADTYKMKFGHRSQNQPCIQAGTNRCFVTSQNHGYSVDINTLPSGWQPWFVNANDRTNEGIRHQSLPFMSVQFHPEAAPGPLDADSLFDEFLAKL